MGVIFRKKARSRSASNANTAANWARSPTVQAGVFLGYASDAGATLLDRRMYLPPSWIEDPAYAVKKTVGAIAASKH
jgi:hypothetical protein